LRIFTQNDFWKRHFNFLPFNLSKHYYQIENKNNTKHHKINIFHGFLIDKKSWSIIWNSGHLQVFYLFFSSNPYNAINIISLTIMKNFWWGFFGVLIAWGIYLRWYALWEPSFWIDEWYSAIISLNVLKNSWIPILPTGSVVYSQYFFSLFQSISFDVLWVNDLTARFPSFLLSLVNLFIFLSFARSLSSFHPSWWNWYVWWVSILYWFSTWQIIWSREARFYEMLSFFCLAGLWSLWQYSLWKRKKLRWWLFSIIAVLWWIFHPFCQTLVAIGWILLIHLMWENWNESLEEASLTSKILALLKKYVFEIGGIITIFVLFQIWELYTSHNLTSLSNYIPQVYELSDEMQKGYVRFYLEHLWWELGIVFVAFLAGLCFLAYHLKTRELILFWAFFAINFYFISHKWMLAHTRYMYHLHVEIILLWTYFLFEWSEYLRSLIPSQKKIYTRGIWTILGAIIIGTTSLQLVPKLFYEIDFTSPKPDFKAAYEYLDTQNASNIISWFPHLCVWYSQGTSQRCKAAWKLNLSLSEEWRKSIEKQKSEWYTNIPYINNIFEISLPAYFVIDNLSRKNIVDSSILQEVEKKCSKVWEKTLEAKIYNTIEIWKCETLK